MTRRQPLSSRTKTAAGLSFENFLTTLGETHDESVYGAIERLVQAGEQVGLSIPDLLQMLDRGTTLESLLEVIELKMTGCFHPESTTA